MRHLHPAAWAGLLLNGMLTYVLFDGINTLMPTDVSPMDPMLLKALELLRPIMLLFLGLQAAALGLIASRSKAGIALAIIASFFMLPSSLVYLMGCILSHYRWKYAGYEYIAAYSRIEEAFSSTAAVSLPYYAGGGFALAAICFSAGMVDMGVIFLGLGLTCVYLSLRARKFYALTLHQDYFTAAPGLFVDPLLIPYAAVSEATLYDDESIHFTLTPKEGRAALLIWSLLRVEKKKRRAALESLGAALTAHHVPLH